MPLSDEGTRKLPYPLSKTFQPIAETPNDGTPQQVISGFPDETTKVSVTMTLSLDEYVALATAVDVGRDIAFGDDSELIWWIWCRAFSEGTVMACEDVADCVESELAASNQSLINALIQNNISGGTGGNYNRVNGDVTTVLDRNPPLSLQESINPEFECDLDKLWGGIRHGIVERLDDTARDLLEDLAAINDTPQRFQAFIDVIPVLGDLAEGVVTLATEVIPDILNLYNSYSSEEQLDAIACDLFALVCSECRYPTFEELYNYYSTLGYEMSAMEAQTLAPLLQKISGMISTFQPASVVYHSMITFQLFTLYIQSQWNGNAGINSIAKFASIGEDFGSNNWFDICESCNEQYAIEVWDFKTQGAGEWYADTNPSTSKNVFVSGTGWMGTQLSTGRRIDVYRKFDPSWVIRGVAFNIGGNPASASQQWNRRTSFGTGGTLSAAGGAGGGYSRCFSGYVGLTGFAEIGIFVNGALANEFYLERVAILYTNGNAPGTATPTVDATPCP